MTATEVTKVDPVGLAAQLIDAGHADTVYRDVYLQRAWTLLGGVFSMEEFRHTEEAQAELVRLPLTIGRAGVLSNRAIAAGELETLLSLLGPPSERQRSDLKRATDIVLVEEGELVYWPRTGEQFHIRGAAYTVARVQATLA